MACHRNIGLIFIVIILLSTILTLFLPSVQSICAHDLRRQKRSFLFSSSSSTTNQQQSAEQSASSKERSSSESQSSEQQQQPQQESESLLSSLFSSSDSSQPENIDDSNHERQQEAGDDSHQRSVSSFFDPSQSSASSFEGLESTEQSDEYEDARTQLDRLRLWEQEEEEEKKLRLEHIKLQILNKLGLNEVPKATKKRDIDYSYYLNLFDAITPPPPPPPVEPPVAESGEADKVFIFPVTTARMKATFNLTSKGPSSSNQPINKIILMTKQKMGRKDSSRPLAVVGADNSQVLNNDTDAMMIGTQAMRVLGYVRPEEKERATDRLSEKYSGMYEWVKYDLTQLLTSEDSSEFISVESENFHIYSWFMTIEYADKKMQRSRRSADCNAVEGNSSTCCRQSFYVNFTQIGWDNWIIAPRGYYANFCRGTCEITHARYHHTTVVYKYPNLITLCCSPREMSPLSLIYADDKGDIFQRVLPNMIVESCDCA